MTQTVILLYFLLPCNIVGVTCLFPSIFKALPSIHPSMNLWGRRTAEPIRPFPNDRANEVRKRRTRRGHREPSALNVNGKDIIRVRQPSPLHSLSSLSILPLLLILSNVPSHLPQFPSLLLFLSPHSPLRVIPVPPNTHCFFRTVPLSCPLWISFLLNSYCTHPSPLSCFFR